MKGKNLTRKAGEKEQQEGDRFAERGRIGVRQKEKGRKSQREEAGKRQRERERNRERGAQNERQKCEGGRMVRGSPDTWWVLWLWATKL